MNGGGGGDSGRYSSFTAQPKPGYSDLTLPEAHGPVVGVNGRGQDKGQLLPSGPWKGESEGLKLDKLMCCDVHIVHCSGIWP